MNYGREKGWYDTYIHFYQRHQHLSNIEQVRVVDLFRHTSISYTVTPTISSSGWRVDGMGPMSNSPITTNSISWKSQQSTTFILVMGGIVAGLRPISTSPFNINFCSQIARGRVDGLLWNTSTSINISSVITRGIVDGQTWPTPTTYAINWGRVADILIPMYKTFTTSVIMRERVAGIKRAMSTALLYQRQFMNFLFRNFIIIITTEEGRMAGLTRPIS